MTAGDSIFVGKGGGEAQALLLKYANRHGLIAGATGTGKTVSLQVLAEGFSKAGVPVFLADVKGDLAGISQAGGANPKIAERAALLGMTDHALEANPTVVWDVFGEQGHPIRATISEGAAAAGPAAGAERRSGRRAESDVQGGRRRRIAAA